MTFAMIAAAQDAGVTDPDLSKVLFENDRLRLHAYRDQHGGETRIEAHPAFLVYALMCSGGAGRSRTARR